MFSIISKHISIYVARLCCLDHVARWCRLLPLVFHSSSLEENHWGHNHTPSTYVCNHSGCLAFITGYCLESMFPFNSNNFLRFQYILHSTFVNVSDIVWQKFKFPLAYPFEQKIKEFLDLDRVCTNSPCCRNILRVLPVKIWLSLQIST